MENFIQECKNGYPIDNDSQRLSCEDQWYANDRISVQHNKRSPTTGIARFFSKDTNRNVETRALQSSG